MVLPCRNIVRIGSFCNPFITPLVFIEEHCYVGPLYSTIDYMRERFIRSSKTRPEESASLPEHIVVIPVNRSTESIID